MNDNDNDFERKLKIALASAGITQAALATTLGVAPSTLNAWLRGRHPAPGGEGRLIANIEAALGLPSGSLGGGR